MAVHVYVVTWPEESHEPVRELLGFGIFIAGQSKTLTLPETVAETLRAKGFKVEKKTAKKEVNDAV